MSAKYYLYRNLHTGTFSLKYRGKVIRHPASCLIHNVEFKVSSKGQARVRKEKRKNVHATLAGTHITRENAAFTLENYQEIYYNPYHHDTFVYENGMPIHKADKAICFNNKIYVIK